MVYNFSELKNKGKAIEDWLARELLGVRTGRAVPSILDSVQVESYGAKMRVNQLASISVEDAKTLRVAPWDLSQSKQIEKAVVASNLGLGVALDDKGLRITFPELTSERRTALLKVAKEKLEQAKVSLRTARDEIWKDIQAKETAGTIGEDEKFRLKNEMQKIVDGVGKQLEEHYSHKEKEIAS